jgi:hypothetical protein
MLSRIPGMPQVPAAVTNPQVQRAVGAMVSNPEVQRVAGNVARVASKELVRTAAQIDTKDVAGSLGRVGGRWAAKIRKSMSDTPDKSAPRR